MGLIGNKISVSTGVHRAFGDAPSNIVPKSTVNWNYMCAQDGASTTLSGLAYPQGGSGSNAWFQPQVGGEMALRADAAGDLSADLIPSRAMEIDLTGAGDLDATAGLAVAMAIALAGSGALSATVEGRLNASVNLTGAGDLDASLSALGNMVVDLIGAGDMDATVAAFGDMSIDIVVTGSGLSTANVGEAVWSYINGNEETRTQLLQILKAAKLAVALSA